MEKIIHYTKQMVKKIPSHLAHEVPSTNGDADRALLIIRLGLGYFFIYHGLGYFFGFDPLGGITTFSGLLAFTGFPAPTFFAYLVAFVELFGGIAIVLGFFTRVFGVLLSVIAIVAFTTVHHFTPGLAGGDIDILALVASLALMFAGPGQYSLAELWYREDLTRGTKTDAIELTAKKENKKEEKQREKGNEVVFPVEQRAEPKNSKKEREEAKKNERSKKDDDALEDIYQSLMLDDPDKGERS